MDSQQPNASISEPNNQNETPRNWLDLPTEVTSTILHKLGAYEILKTAQWVCTNWLNISKDPSIWRSIYFHISIHDDDDDSYMSDAESLAYIAVDRSCGQLVEFSMEYVATDDFIGHLAHNASQLRRLRLISCHDLDEDILKETAHKFPHLEELELRSSPFSKGSMEAVGRGCPQMTSLKLNYLDFIPLERPFHDDIALPIAETMQHLCHLQLIGNIMTNDGLRVILNGCPSLESLDLRGSHFVDLKDDSISKESLNRIKLVRYPNEPIGDDEFGKRQLHGYNDDSLDEHAFDYFDPFGDTLADSDIGDLFFDEENLFYDDYDEYGLDYELEEGWFPWM